MQNAASSSPTPSSGSNLVKIVLIPLQHVLCTGDPAATVDRLFSSQHVRDLQLIIAFAAVGVVLVFGLGYPIAVYYGHQLDGVFVFLVPLLGVFGAVLAWAYQVGSVRLGVVDLFACEVSTLCRVTTIVDTARRYAEKFDRGPPTVRAGSDGPHEQAYQFTSRESYFPVFDSNARDLQTLEARVVINITAFYTYLKAFRDYLRVLAEISHQFAESDTSTNTALLQGSWHETVVNVVYMLFLGLESARLAIADLVEFEPERAERTIVILISELEAYRFLCLRFPDENDIRHQRLYLREADYRDLVPELWRSVEARRACEIKEVERRDAPKVRRWEPAWRLLPELRARYQACAIPDQPTALPSRLSDDRTE
jgi:hypothetical protein